MSHSHCTLSASSQSDVTSWLNEIHKRRTSVGPSATEFNFAKCRVRVLKGPNLFPEFADNIGKTPGGVLYWMIRDQRVQDNWAFLYAQRLAMKFEVPLHACFCLVPHAQANTLRHFTFMIDGLAELEKECRELHIPFHLLTIKPHSLPSCGIGMKRKYSESVEGGELFACATSQAVCDLVQKLNIGCVLTDVCPLREPTAWVDALTKCVPQNVPVCQVDAHNVVPVWYASDKLEYAARTIRRKLHDKAKELWTEFPPLVSHPYRNENNDTEYCFLADQSEYKKSKCRVDVQTKLHTGRVEKKIDWEKLKSIHNVDRRVPPVTWAKGGTEAGMRVLFTFIDKRLRSYEEGRNDPNKVSLSDLSPWFHFGQIAPQRALMEVRNVRNRHPASADAFIEEAFVRRELADNFCFYNSLYDSIEGAWDWAKTTLRIHANDKRDPAYSGPQFEDAKTKDDLWNACQRQLAGHGKLHGFLRMYWAKKILEWHKDGPDAALQLALYLNDRYSLDGTDPNGFVGVMWSICGVHDQGWAERPVFGKIRCMTYDGCKRKFSIPAFTSKYHA